MIEAGDSVIVFDAECVLCSANARFVLRYDRHRLFRLASMQSEAGIALYQRFGIDPAIPETLIVVTGDKAFRTGDGGYVDAEGRLFWEGRLNDIIKTGGANVSPIELDEVLRECPGVKISQTIGVPDDLLGEWSSHALSRMRGLL